MWNGKSFFGEKVTKVFIDEEVCPTNFKQFPKITKFQVFKGIFIARRKNPSSRSAQLFKEDLPYLDV